MARIFEHFKMIIFEALKHTRRCWYLSFISGCSKKIFNVYLITGNMRREMDDKILLEMQEQHTSAHTNLVRRDKIYDGH